jgi:hypothetical protein
MDFTVEEGKKTEGFRVEKYPHGLSVRTTLTIRETEANMRETFRSRPMWSSSRNRFSLPVSLHTPQLPFPSLS